MTFPRSRRLQDVGEKAVLAAIREAVGDRRPRARAPGDDAAIVDVGRSQFVVSTDMLVENKDFRLAWASVADVGAKAAMVNLSDMAAMGAVPRGLLLSVAMAKSMYAHDLLTLVRHAHRVGRAYGAPVIGGDLSETDGPMVVSVTALGEMRHAPLQRHQGRIGDIVAITGEVGNAAAGLSILEEPARYRALRPSTRRELVQAQLRPRAPVRLAPRLAQSGLVRSAADVSDGLLADGLHVVRANEGLVIDVTRLPLSRALVAAARCRDRHAIRARRHAFQWALSGGEDFGLLLACAPHNWSTLRTLCNSAGVACTAIGRIVRTPGLRLWPAAAASLQNRGFAHFR